MESNLKQELEVKQKELRVSRSWLSIYVVHWERIGYEIDTFRYCFQKEGRGEGLNFVLKGYSIKRQYTLLGSMYVQDIGKGLGI